MEKEAGRNEAENYLQKDPVQFWNYLRSIKAGIGKYKFSLMCEFMDFLVSLPHSSASAERQFSLLKLIKSPLRNRIESASSESIALLGGMVQTWGGEGHCWEILSKLIERSSAVEFVF